MSVLHRHALAREIPSLRSRADSSLRSRWRKKASGRSCHS